MANSYETQLREAYRQMIRAMLDRRADELEALLDDEYTLTHMTGYRQTKREWLEAIASGPMRYRAAEELVPNLGDRPAARRASSGSGRRGLREWFQQPQRCDVAFGSALGLNIARDAVRGNTSP